jgi:hypothetical protein
MLNRRMSAAGSSTFWATRSNEYRVELWDADGRHRRTLVGERSWFKPRTTSIWGVRDTPPSTTMGVAEVDDDGLLWLNMSVAAENWRDALGGEDDMEGNAVLIPGKLYKRTIIEVIDPVEGKLLARRELPYQFTGFVAPGLLSHTWLDELGLPRLEVIPLRLVGR